MSEYDNFRRLLADGLARFKARRGMNNLEVGNYLGIGHTTVSRILNEETVMLNQDTFLRVLGAAGMVIRRKKDDTK